MTELVNMTWSGCALSRKSTNSGCLMWRGVCLKAWSTTQGVVALSGGEAEYYAAVTGASEGLAFSQRAWILGDQVPAKHSCSDRQQCVQRDLAKDRLGEG